MAGLRRNTHAERAIDDVMQSGQGNVAELLRSFRSFLRENDMMAYLTMMAVRLLELHRALKPTGGLSRVPASPDPWKHRARRPARLARRDRVRP